MKAEGGKSGLPAGDGRANADKPAGAGRRDDRWSGDASADHSNGRHPDQSPGIQCAPPEARDTRPATENPKPKIQNPKSPWLAWEKFRRHRAAMAGLVLLGLFFGAAVFGPFVYRFDSVSGDLREQFLPPSASHSLGTDEFGRDQLARVLYGLRVSLIVGLVAAAINVVLGSLYGGIAGYFGGKVDDVMMRIVEVFYGIPLLLVVMLLMKVLPRITATGDGLLNVFIAIGLVYWLGMARIVRGQVLSLKEQEYVAAARALGATPRRILLRHLLPNTLGIVIVTGTLRIPEAIFIEAFLSFIGLGIAEPAASLGSLVSSGLSNLESQPWLLLGPSVAISLLMLAFNFVGDGLRDAFDPQMRA